MTTTQLQLRRDTTANVGAITPAQGELIADITRKALVLGDGATLGGLCVTPFARPWTPQLEFGGAAVGMTGTFSGWGCQIGPVVVVGFLITLTAKGSSSGAAAITGLPVAVLSGTGSAVPISSHQNLATSPVFECYVGGTYGLQSITLGKSGSTSQANLADADFTNTSVIEGVAVYQAAQPTG
jgi:hypothetical protein